MSSEMIWTLLTIIGIDIVLGGDNAIVVALACRHLPENMRNKAIILGIMFAVLSRGLLTVIAVQLLAIPYLMGIGGFFLIWIAFRLVKTENSHNDAQENYSVSDAIKTIVIADVVMGFDNVIAVAGAADGNPSLVIAGLIISVPIIIWGSKLILYLMEKFPVIIYLGAAILLYTAGKMIVHEDIVVSLLQLSAFPADFFVPGLVIIGLLIAWITQRIQGIKIMFYSPARKK
ncbi:TerC family protein [Salipaludibacillus sp. CUR1]|uniref:TerC family protein n=1 Tax=Salipaludibacillus sp. CUR1 TaxID=2820003 RepID=UPI001E31DA6D|nr:TerC family protein [Salipaludibacillus sp. CUR1]MCE7794864.1 TerC family protein [Salipaludibacillus sp. CUR1]